jgi:putative toxin-antitoxin system antitoxin component (TIGR02293 family)
LYRVYLVLMRARKALNNDEGARQWIRTPQKALANRTPLSMLVRDVSAQDAFNLLAAI